MSDIETNLRIVRLQVALEASDAALTAVRGALERIEGGHYDLPDEDDDEALIVAMQADARRAKDLGAGRDDNGIGAQSPSKDFIEGRDAALANAAMLAYDMGHPDVRVAINQLFPEDSPARPIDTPPGNPPTRLASTGK